MAFTKVLPAGISTSGTVVLENITATGGIDADFLGTSGPSGIQTSIPDTAVDVFVYDTSRDSDGGAWRKRTQHTSWYNEELNTATRGSRREFPAVAVIVAETSSITIYDGDDPDLPMWMVFENAGVISWSHGGTSVISTISILNGVFVFGLNDGNGGIYLNFVKDNMRAIFGNGNLYDLIGFTREIINRNQSFSYSNNPSGDGINIANSIINDVAMTVLPTAPIDPDTGLQVPTIAVATNDGISVIKDNGTVISTTSSGSGYYIRKINFTDNFGINAIISNSSGGNWANLYVNDFKSLDGFTYAQYNNWDGVVYRTKYDPKALTYLTASTNDTISNFISLDGRSNAIGVPAIGGGLTILEKSPRSAFDPDEGMVAYATTSYNTGWMHGDIKGAFLSDTSTTSLPGSNFVANGDFSAGSTGWALQSGWTIGSGTASCDGTNGAYIYQIAGLPADTDITVTVTITNYTSGSLRLGSNNVTPTITFSETGTHSTTFRTRSSSESGVELYSINFVGTVDNVSAVLADQDRSVNKKGLQVFGTITKSAVATGAELVAYSGFTNSIYLKQPVNTDLPSNSTDTFSMMAWVKTTTDGTAQYALSFGEADTNKMRALGINFTTGTLIFSSGGTTLYGGANIGNGQWQFICCTYNGSGVAEIYVNGTSIISGSVTLVNSTSPTVIIGNNNYLDRPFDGSISLARISASAPSAEQIRKIYNDEKVLFQENANATLYGSSDAVTALAYDEKTNLLHVGTSSGRSDFNGLRRINNTTEAVTTAISAYDGSIAQQ
jgi:hypothetical protein